MYSHIFLFVFFCAKGVCSGFREMKVVYTILFLSKLHSAIDRLLNILVT